MIARQLTTGFIAGIDHSKVMYRQTLKRLGKYVDKGNVNPECGTIADLVCPAGYFDVVFGNNVHFFWEGPVNEFKKMKPVTCISIDGRK